jgi:CheY-like chemotaxis protein
VRIYSEIGQGTTVCIYLPRHEGEEQADVGAAVTVEMHPSAAGRVALVIDDEPVIRMLIADVLADLGYVGVEASDGPSGLRLLQSMGQIDLLITDVGLPGGLNGRQVADAARVARPDLKVLFITGYAENAAIGNGHLGRGEQVTAKPFAMDDLARKIRSMVEEI